jgi:hypothetical protein
MNTITKHYIDGAFVESHGREVMEIINPTNRKVIAQVTLGDEDDARRAVLTNSPWLDKPDTTLGDAAFGQITTAQGTQSVKVNMNRSFQGSLRITF